MSVIVRLNGGLGNQIFQYAAGRALARRNGVPLLIDTTQCERNARPYSLDVFNISAAQAYPAGFGRTMFRASCSNKPALRPLSPPIRSLLGIRLIRESSPHRVDPAVRDMRAKGTVCLEGCWQAPGYFSDAAEVLRQELTFKHPATGQNQAILREIAAGNAVSVHIRRGDYLALATSPVLTLSYYHRAIAYLEAHVQPVKFFVFSDDIEWAKAHFPEGRSVSFVDVNPESAGHEDLRLMAACKHHIIANSSFSWWGAWLKGAVPGMVIAPKYWMCRRETYYPELFPSTWTCIEN